MYLLRPCVAGFSSSAPGAEHYHILHAVVLWNNAPTASKMQQRGEKEKGKKMSGRRQPGKGKGHNFSKRLGKKGKKNQLNLWRASLQAAKSEKTAAAQEKARTKAAVHAAAAALAASVLSRGESNVQELLAYEPTNEGQHIRRTTLLAFYTDMKIYPLKAESTRLEAVAGAYQEAWQQVCVCVCVCIF
jgi:hypothetical protein